MKECKAAAHLGELLGQVVSILSSSTFRSMSTHECQPVRTGIHLGVLDDVPIWHPRSHYAKRKKTLRNLNDGEHVRVRFAFAPFDYTTEFLA